LIKKFRLQLQVSCAMKSEESGRSFDFVPSSNRWSNFKVSQASGN